MSWRDFLNDEGVNRGLQPSSDYKSIFNESPIDAFRHTSMSAIVTDTYGSSIASALGSMQEQGFGSVLTGEPVAGYVDASIQDEFSNAIGRQVSESIPSKSYPGRTDGVQQARYNDIMNAVEKLVRDGVTINSLKDLRIGQIKENLLPGESIPDMLARTGGTVAGPRGTGYSLYDPRGPWQDPNLVDPNVRGKLAPGGGPSSSNQDPRGSLGSTASHNSPSSGSGSNSAYHDPIMDAAKKYSSSKVYHDPIMDMAKTYHPPAQPLAHPISVTPPPRAPSLSYGALAGTTAMNNLPYSLGTPVVSAPHLSAPQSYAPNTSPFPAPRPAHVSYVNGHQIYTNSQGVSTDVTKLENLIGDGIKNPTGMLKEAIGGGFHFVPDPSYEKQDHGSTGSGGGSHQDASERNKDHRGKPILLDLDGNGVKINELSRSGVFKDAGGDGLMHRTAWAGTGDGVLFFDADADGTLSQKREYVFTEWDPTANTDMEALRSYFDSNGDGKLTSADAAFAQFKVLVTNPDGSTTVRSGRCPNSTSAAQ